MFRTSSLLVAGALAYAGSSASGQIVKDLGFGWEVVILDPIKSDVVSDPPSSLDKLVLQKFAEFDSLDPILLLFRQNKPDAETAPVISITDEVIFNNSGFDWIDFEIILLDGAQLEYDVAASADFTISPFTDREYLDANTKFRVFGGTVSDGDVWTPGLVDGELVINIDLAADAPVVWTLKEIPSIPSPSGLALIGLGALAGARRRR